MAEPTASAPTWKPSVLFVYYTYTQQTLKVVQAMAGVLRGRGCDVALAAIEFTDPRYADRFKQFPMPHPFRELVGMIPAESPRRRPAKIAIPAVGPNGTTTWYASGPPPGGCPPTFRSGPFCSPRPRAGSWAARRSPPPSAAAGTGNTTSRRCAGSAPSAAGSSPTASTSATREARCARCCRC